MARIRSVHPGLTSDESYMSMSMTAKAAWTPLWMQCDDHGIFEWKPIVLKALIFPADNVDFALVLSELEQLDCIRKIDIAGRPHGVVRNFARYQRPKNPSYRHFKADELPADLGSYIGIKGAAPPVLPQSSPSPPEILPQMKEEGDRRKEEEKKDTPSASRPSTDEFENLKKVFPRRKGNYGWKAAERKFNSLVKTGVPPSAIIAAAKRLCETLRSKIGTEFIPMPASWLNSEDFLDVAVANFEDAPINWDVVLRGYTEFKHWARDAGPDPTSPACYCPPEILKKYGVTLPRLDA
jgi:hypothetical protein